VIATVLTVDGAFGVDLDTEEVVEAEPGGSTEDAAVDLPLLVAAARSGSTVVAVLDRRPPVVVSHDAGATWREAGGGLPPGTAVALAEDDPDLVVYAARNRLYVSRDGGRFWQALTPELPEIVAVAVSQAASAAT
jgi:photosystem II stability/assembly factor-like uncharacterized protein